MQGFSFCLAAYKTHTQALTAAFLPSMQNYTSKTPKPFIELYSGISVNLTHSSAHNTAAKQAAYTPTAPRWRAYPQAQHLHRYQIPPQHRTLYRAGSPPIIIRYIRVQLCARVVDPCPAVQHSADHASLAAVCSYRLRIAGKR